VAENVLFPKDWRKRWPDFGNHVAGFKAVLKANDFLDAPDCLSSIVTQKVFEPSPESKKPRRSGLL
jgi:hypothetical protein